MPSHPSVSSSGREGPPQGAPAGPEGAGRPPDRNPLAAPLRLPCGAVLPNRLAKSAMSEAIGSPGHGPTPALEHLYRVWAEGGAGLLLTGNVMVDRSSLSEPGNVVLEDDRDLEAFRRWAAAAHRPGHHAWLQLNHPGRQAPRTLTPQPVAPSAVPMELTTFFAPPRPLEEAEIEALVARFARAATLGQQAGFSGVQIHAAHGYLISQFLSPFTNRRRDGWGGSPAGRRRFLLAIVAAVRAAVGPAYPVAVKLNSADFQRGGFDEEDALAVVADLAAAGIDLLEISGGTYEKPSMMGSQRASTVAREAYFLDFARRVRAISPVPLMVTGGFRSAAAMGAALAEGALDVIGLGRPLTLEPDLCRRLLAGTATAALPARRFAYGRWSGFVDLAWHSDQLRRIAAGLPPDRRRAPLAAIAALLLSQGISGLARRRPGAGYGAASGGRETGREGPP